MILKIQASADGKTWWVLDNLAKIRFRDEIEFVTQDEKPQEACISLMVRATKTSEDISYTYMIVRDRNDKETSIMFDMVAYICNDNGKTLEKVVGH